jgi:hypothetical protein
MASDDFYSGYCCALSAAMNGEDGTATAYVEAVAACGAKELLAFAQRTDDMELPKIRAAVAELKRINSYRAGTQGVNNG